MLFGAINRESSRPAYSADDEQSFHCRAYSNQVDGGCSINWIRLERRALPRPVPDFRNGAYRLVPGSTARATQFLPSISSHGGDSDYIDRTRNSHVDPPWNTGIDQRSHDPADERERGCCEYDRDQAPRRKSASTVVVSIKITANGFDLNQEVREFAGQLIELSAWILDLKQKLTRSRVGRGLPFFPAQFLAKLLRFVLPFLCGPHNDPLYVPLGEVHGFLSPLKKIQGVGQPGAYLAQGTKTCPMQRIAPAH